MEKLNHIIGKVVYDPRRPEMRNRGTINWCVVEIHRDFSRYVRWHLNRHYLDCLDLIQPAFDCHMSIVRGERIHPRLQALWKKHDGKLTQIRWGLEAHLVRNPNGDQFWVTSVECPLALQIRRELGLPTDWSFHVTVGKPRWVVSTEDD